MLDFEVFRIIVIRPNVPILLSFGTNCVTSVYNCIFENISNLWYKSARSVHTETISHNPGTTISITNPTPILLNSSQPEYGWGWMILEKICSIEALCRSQPRPHSSHMLLLFLSILSFVSLWESFLFSFRSSVFSCFLKLSILSCAGWSHRFGPNYFTTFTGHGLLVRRLWLHKR